MSIKVDIEEFAKYFDEAMEIKLNDIKSIPPRLYEAIEYILFSGGKRIRPFLMIESYKIFDKDFDKIMDFALALEMIHTYSLVHDDLPAMDNDDYRRGKLTVHKVYGEDLAILVGDSLLNLAYELIAKNMEKCISIQDFKLKTRAYMEIANYSGARGMIGGQVLDMEMEKNKTEVDILKMYELKTGGLFKAATTVGSILGQADSIDVEKMREFGRLLGLAYQVQDDILDHEEDLEIDKATVSTEFGKEQALKICEDYSSQALFILEEVDSKRNSSLKDLTEVLMGRSY